MNRSRRSILVCAAGTVALTGAPRARAQQLAWPARPIRLIVPTAAGSQPDGIARLFAEHLRPALGQTVVVDNRPGANQTIGLGAMTASPPDGYTLLLTSTELVRVPLLYPNIKYDPFKDFMPLTQVASTATLMAVPTSLGAGTLHEFIALAKASPTPLTIGSPGQGSGAHFYGELLARQTGIRLDHVPYRGEVPLVPDLLGGRLAAGWISGHIATQFVNEGKIKVLGVASSKNRIALLPDVPTFREQGIPGLDIGGFIGFFANAGTSAAITGRLVDALNKIAGRLDMRAQLERIYGVIPIQSSSPADFAAAMRASSDGWVQAIKATNIKLE